MKSFTFLISLLFCSQLSWPGFLGLDKRGYAPRANPPAVLSREESLLWEAELPGHGHSSPVISGNLMYVTCAYSSPTARVLFERGSLLLTILLYALGYLSVILILKQTKGLLRSFLASACLSGIAAVTFFGEKTLGLASPDAVTWLAVSGATLGCLVLPPCLLPRRSRWTLVSGLLSLIFAPLAWFFHPERRLFLNFASKAAIAGICLLYTSPSPRD